MYWVFVYYYFSKQNKNYITQKFKTSLSETVFENLGFVLNFKFSAVLKVLLAVRTASPKIGFQLMKSCVVIICINANVSLQGDANSAAANQIVVYHFSNLKCCWTQKLYFVVLQAKPLQLGHFCKKFLVECLNFVVDEIQAIHADQITKCFRFDLRNLVVVQIKTFEILHVLEIKVTHNC